MYKKVCITITLLIILISANQESNNWLPEWTTSFEFIMQPHSALLDKDSDDIYICGDNSTYKSSPRVMSFNQQSGEKQWEKIIETELYGSAYDIKLFPENLFVISTKRETQKSYYNILTKEGNLTQKRYLNKKDIYSAAKYKSDSLILIEQNGEGVFHVMNSNFMIIRSVKFADFITGQVTASVSLKDSSIIISGIGYNNKGLTNLYSFIQKNDLYSGELTWRLEIEDGIRCFHDTDKEGNAYFGLTQMIKKNESKLCQYKVIKLNQNGETDWEKVWHQENTIGENKANWINRLKTNKDQLLTIVGHIERDGKNWAYFRVMRQYDGSTFREKELKFNQTSEDHAIDNVVWDNRQLYLIGKSYGTITKSYLQHYDLRILETKPAPETKDFKLYQNYPNPFNSSTTIEYYLPKVSRITLEIFNTAGQRIKRLTQKKQKGTHEFRFNANPLTSGMYFYRIQADNFTKTKKMLLVK